MSTYVSAPGVPRAKIGVYPKRRGSSSFARDEPKATRADVVAESTISAVTTTGSLAMTTSGREVRYGDFFRTSPEAVQAEVA